jgi:hypothetical protein
MRAPCAALALALACAACSNPAGTAPAEPAGAALVARRAPLAALLGGLARLEGTPLGRRARSLSAALPDCAELEAAAPAGDARALLDAPRCGSDAAPLAALRAARGDADLAFVWPLAPGLALRGTLRVRPTGDVEAALELPRAAARGARGLLVPGETAAGPAALSAEEQLLHARVRPAGGLDLAALVPPGGQGDRLFRLRSELFRGLVLDGTWEAALYLPGPGESVLRAAVAVGFTQREAAVAAAEAFVEELSRTWPVRRSFFAHAGAQGACLLDLSILPGFAPCYVATARALVLGYNPASVRRALDGAPPAAAGEAGALFVDLARFAEADARLGAAAPSLAGELPWRELRAEGRAEGELVRVRVLLAIPVEHAQAREVGAQRGTAERTPAEAAARSGTG